MANLIHLIGFGTQGQAWSECFQMSGWEVRPYFREGSQGPEIARKMGLTPRSLKELGTDLEKVSVEKQPALVAILAPDQWIGRIYQEWLANQPTPLCVVLGHGYAVFSGDLVPQHSDHTVALMAPKSIGPQIVSAFRTSCLGPRGERQDEQFHSLVMATFAADFMQDRIQQAACAMGFAPENQVRATFEEETVGDLISEQGLLCGGMFTLLEWTIQAMQKAGIPKRLIREECLSELELIAGLLRAKGPASTLDRISEAALSGTVAMRDQLISSRAREAFDRQIDKILNGEFTEYFRSSDWRSPAKVLTGRFRVWENELFEKDTKGTER